MCSIKQTVLGFSVHIKLSYHISCTIQYYNLLAAYDSDNVMTAVCNVLVQIPQLDEVYASYCANQVFAKSVLDLKKQDAQIEDFLERCLESPFSRHLDLWNFLGTRQHFDRRL